MWYPTTDKHLILRMTGHVQPVTHLAFSPDGRFLASASFDKKIKLWDGRTGEFLHTLNGHVGHVCKFLHIVLINIINPPLPF